MLYSSKNKSGLLLEHPLYNLISRSISLIINNILKTCDSIVLEILNIRSEKMWTIVDDIPSVVGNCIIEGIAVNSAYTSRLMVSNQNVSLDCFTNLKVLLTEPFHFFSQI